TGKTSAKEEIRIISERFRYFRNIDFHALLFVLVRLGIPFRHIAKDTQTGLDPIVNRLVLLLFYRLDFGFPLVHFASSIPRSFCSASFRSRTTSPLFSQRRRGAGFWPSRSRRTS